MHTRSYLAAIDELHRLAILCILISPMILSWLLYTAGRTSRRLDFEILDLNFVF